MRASIVPFIALFAVTASAPRAAESVEAHKSVFPDAIEWRNAPALPAGGAVAVLYGDPAAAGRFVLRMKMPGGYSIPPHTHAQAEIVTVISGALHLGLGRDGVAAGLETLPAGGFSVMPAGVVHYASADGETIVQVDGMGPWNIDYVDPKVDPRLKVAPQPMR